MFSDGAQNRAESQLIEENLPERMDAMIKVLLVDDELFVLEQIRRSIDWEKQGLELIGCSENAVEALEQMIDEMPDILITDIKMPIMDGLELIGRAKQMNPSIQCVVLSGYAEFALAKSAMEQGATNYLLKPFSKMEFEAVLQKSSARILEARSAQILKLEQRTKLVEKLVQELQLLKENYEKVDSQKLKTLMKFYPDLSLLRDASLLLLARQKESKKENIEQISELLGAGEDICSVAAKLLEEIWSEDVNESTLVRKIKEYTKQHYHEEGLNLQMLADNVVHMGAKYIGRCFLKETGCKYSEYLMAVRMEKAIRMLTREDYRIEEIAGKIGLGYDVPYFYQLFKKYTGKTPKEYKQGKRKSS